MTESLKLVDSGKSNFSIALPNDATVSEIYSANELQFYLSQVSGKKLVIIREANLNRGKPYIFVGLSKYVLDNVSKTKLQSLSKDGILLKSIKGNLIIAGGRPRGTLNAVYQFLEDYIGCRWWTPTSSFVPRLTTIVVNKIDITYKPKFYYRDHFIFNTVYSGQFSSVLRENGDDQPLSIDQGGSERILGFAHTFSKILPPSKYFFKHPEWYSDPKNGGVPCTSLSKIPPAQKTQLCLTNEDLYQEFLKNTLKLVKDNPSTEIISVSQNDNNNFCTCVSCSKIITEEGSVSGLILRFVNRIAAQIQQMYPGKKIETLAYSLSLQPPAITRPRTNVIIRVAPTNANWGYPIDDLKNKETMNSILQWSKISSSNFFWGYNTNFVNLLLPHPSFYHVGSDIRFLAATDFKGVFIQDNKYTDGLGYFLDLQAWVIGHLIWDPSLDQQALTKEFMNGYYGAGGAYLLQYMNLVDTCFKKQNINLSPFNQDYSFITLDLLNQGTLLFNKALEAVREDDIRYERVAKEKVAFDFAWIYFYKSLKRASLLNNKKFLGPVNYLEAVDSLFNKINQYNIQRIDRSLSIKEYKEKFVAAAFKTYTSDDFNGKSIIIQQTDFRLYKRGIVTSIDPDKKASDGLVASISGKSNEWAVQADLNNYVPTFSSAKWFVRAWVRVDAKKVQSDIKLGGAVNIGIYDAEKRQTIVESKMPIERLEATTFSRIDLPVTTLDGKRYIWISINDGENSFRTLKVDRIELIKIDE